MTKTSLERLLSKERRVVAAALALLVLLAWVYIFRIAGATVRMELAPWTPSDWVLMSLMWAIMMSGMMIRLTAGNCLLRPKPCCAELPIFSFSR